jgi:hypothetical protein
MTGFGPGGYESNRNEPPAVMTGQPGGFQQRGIIAISGPPDKPSPLGPRGIIPSWKHEMSVPITILYFD